MLARFLKLELLVVIAVLVAIAIGMTWPLIVHMGDASLFPAYGADVKFNIWVIFWGAHALQDPLNMHDANIYYPEKNTFVYSDIELSHSLLLYPIIAAFNDPILTYHFLLLLSLIIGGLGFYLFLKDVTGSRIAAGLAAILYLYSPLHFGRYWQIQFIGDHWLPLFLWALQRWLSGLDTRTEKKQKQSNVLWPALTGLFFILHALSGSHGAIFISVISLSYGLYLMFKHRLLGNKSFWLQTALVALGIIIVLVPIFYPYIIMQKTLSELRVPDIEALNRSSANGLELFSGTSPFYKWLDETTGWPSDFYYGRPSSELFPGIIILMFALLSLFLRKKNELHDKLKARLAIFLDFSILLIVFTLIQTALADAHHMVIFIFRISNPPVLLVASLGIMLMALRLYFLPQEQHLLVRFYKNLSDVKIDADLFFWFGLLLLSFWAALGPQALLYRLVAKIPLVKIIRVPARFTIITLVAVTVLAAYGIKYLRQHFRKPVSTAILVVAFSLFIIESTFAPLPLFARPVVHPMHHWMAEDPEMFTFIEFPLDTNGNAQFTEPMYGSLYHWKRMVVGYSGMQTKENIALLNELNDGFPTDAGLDKLNDLDVKYVFVRESLLSAEELATISQQNRLVEVKRWDSVVAYLLDRKE